MTLDSKIHTWMINLNVSQASRVGKWLHITFLYSVEISKSGRLDVTVHIYDTIIQICPFTLSPSGIVYLVGIVWQG